MVQSISLLLFLSLCYVTCRCSSLTSNLPLRSLTPFLGCTWPCPWLWWRWRPHWRGKISSLSLVPPGRSAIPARYLACARQLDIPSIAGLNWNATCRELIKLGFRVCPTILDKQRSWSSRHMRCCLGPASPRPRSSAAADAVVHGSDLLLLVTVSLFSLSCVFAYFVSFFLLNMYAVESMHVWMQICRVQEMSVLNFFDLLLLINRK